MFKAFHVWLLINCNVCGGVLTMVNMCTNNCHFLKILIKKKSTSPRNIVLKSVNKKKIVCSAFSENDNSLAN